MDYINKDLEIEVPEEYYPTQTTVDALDRSIIHWEDNVALAQGDNLTSSEITGSKCSLCILYSGDNCTRCPLFACGLGCDNEDEYSPWQEVQSAVRDCYPYDGAVVDAAQCMLSTLESIRDYTVDLLEGEQNETS